MTSSLLARTVHAGAAGLLAVTLAACAPTVTSDVPADAPSDGAPATAAATQVPAATSGSNNAGTGTGTPVAPRPSPSALDARWYDLMHVQQTAAPCASVWAVGNVLAEDYQWCADEESNPVAGIRVGPCEVVSYGRTMYAVPGRTIAAVAGSIDRDQAYLDLLTACKRRPFPPSGADRKDAP